MIKIWQKIRDADSTGDAFFGKPYSTASYYLELSSGKQISTEV